MGHLKGKNLGERVTILRHEKQEDWLGGWVDRWTPGENRWALVEPIRGRDGYHPDDLGGGMASGIGFIKGIPAARYRVVMRSPCDLSETDRIQWHVGDSRLILELSAQPYYVQNKMFVCLSMVEMKETDHG